MIRVTINFGQARKRIQKLLLADCTTLNGYVTRMGDIREKPISKSTAVIENQCPEWSGFCLYTHA